MNPTILKFDFTNKEGLNLSGRLELPLGKPKAFAILAHCFTCSKDFIASARIARNLSALGIGVLRFDFTGLGHSEGDFANTNFSSNIQDLMSAYHAISEKFEPPKLLIGHSLGGAAVLKCSALLEQVEAVVTIGAPSDLHHVTSLFDSADFEKINSEGEADVQLAGRTFKIKKQFIDDINEHTILESLSQSRKAFLILHSPTDEIVSIDHADKLFRALKYPKSFVSLDHADHLLTKATDAEYAAQIICAWAGRFMPTNTTKRPRIEAEVEVRSRDGHLYTHDIYSKNNHIVADEPAKLKGEDLGMNPYELLLSSLGACTSMTMKMYAERKGIPLHSVRIELNHQKKYFEDCRTCEDKPKLLDSIEKKIHLTGDFTPEQKNRLLEIAEKCPINQTLHSEVVVKTLSTQSL